MKVRVLSMRRRRAVIDGAYSFVLLAIRGISTNNYRLTGMKGHVARKENQIDE